VKTFIGLLACVALVTSFGCQQGKQRAGFARGGGISDTPGIAERSAQNAWESGFKGESLPRDDGVVSVKWDVIYDKMGHDVVLRYDVRTAKPDAVLLQIRATNEHRELWPPELHPFVQGVVEFTPDAAVKQCVGGVIDSKWKEPEDKGEPFAASVHGVVSQGGKLVRFGPITKTYRFQEGFDE
jgi:hypothetical protein